MSKSRNNAIFLSSTEDETVKLVKKAKTDAERLITYEPERRPEVANLLFLVSLCTGEDPAAIAARIGEGGAGKLKELVSETLNEYFRPVRARRRELEANPDYVRKILLSGIASAREVAQSTLDEVRASMNMNLGF
jgi:tryptophanyl-tRNA synthetase